MLKKPELFQQGYHLTHVSLPDSLREAVVHENWNEVDKIIKEITGDQGSLNLFLQNYHSFKEIEFIISVRDASNDWEEDGIWHDDGSRVFAFSLSLTLNEIKGGRLGMRFKGEEKFTLIPTPSYGGIILFLTGIYGLEHKIHQVTVGKRIIIAGWCT